VQKTAVNEQYRKRHIRTNMHKLQRPGSMTPTAHLYHLWFENLKRFLEPEFC
jgi:hypothetical protein